MLTHAELEQMREMHARGASLRDIGLTFDMTKQGVQYHLTKSTRPHVPTASMIELYERGLSLERVGQEVGLTGAAISLRFKRAGYSTRSYSPRPQESESLALTTRMVELYAGGMTLKQVGEVVGRTGPTVLMRLRCAGQPTRRQGPVPGQRNGGTDLMMALAASSYATTGSIRTTGALLGYSYERIRQLLVMGGVKLQNRGRRRKT